MNGQHSAQPGSSSRRTVQQGHSSSSYTVPLYDTSALTAALSNPYAQQHAQYNISPHYYQAYVQAYNNRAPLTTPEGYTLSSTYVPGRRATQVPLTMHAPSRQDRVPTQTQAQTSTTRIINPLTYGSWYQPGNCQCTRQGCSFTGSRKSVEIHMMDRHFIYPREWGKSKKDDWDADPSLKGKPIAIQGTSLVLDTPEAVNGWIEERKKRFPTAEKVEEKKRKREEAAARGELAPEDIGLGARKRQRQDTTSTDGSIRGSQSQGHRGVRGRGRGRCRGRARGGPMERELPPRSENIEATPLIDAKPVCDREDSTGSTSGDEGPEVLSSKVCVEPPPTTLVENGDVGEMRIPQARHRERTRNAPQPKKPPRNPFASRPTLLRNLLLPEIRITISNLSQAIHFLVDNDFLRDVELRPGEAQEKMIEVLASGETVENSSQPTSGEAPV